MLDFDMMMENVRRKLNMMHEAGWTFVDIAAEAGVHNSEIGMIANRKVECISLRTYVAIANLPIEPAPGTPSALNKRARDLIIESRIPYARVADMSGVSRFTISKLMNNGDRRMHGSSARRIIAALEGMEAS